jgi:hypothetical protein
MHTHYDVAFFKLACPKIKHALFLTNGPFACYYSHGVSQLYGVSNARLVFELKIDVKDARNFFLLSLLLPESSQTGIVAKRESLHSDTLSGLQELLVYGLKGLAAYAHHAERLDSTDDAVYAFVHEALAFLASDAANDPAAVLEKCMEAGRVNFRVMQLLDEGHNRVYDSSAEPRRLHPMQSMEHEPTCAFVSR